MHNVIATRSSRAITTVDVTAIVVSIDLQQRSSSCENSVHLHQPEERVVPCGTLRGKRLREWVNLRVGVGVGDVVVAVGVGVVRFNFLFRFARKLTWTSKLARGQCGAARCWIPS